MPRANKSEPVKPNPVVPAHDPRALKILFDTYWSPKGWKPHPWNGPPPVPPPSDFEYAKAKGIMFPHVVETRDKTVARAREVARKISLRRVSNAFVASLETRRLELRSALGSFAAARHFPGHKCKANGSQDEPHLCAICGLANQDGPCDRNVLNFERFKWGGVRHTDVEYFAHDLEQFCFEKEVTPSPKASQMLRSVLAAVASMPKRAQPSDLERAIADLFPSNKAERRVVLEIFGICGVLEPKAKPSYRKRFIPHNGQSYPPSSKSDWGYPIAWWRGSDGVNDAAVREWFPSLANRA